MGCCDGPQVTGAGYETLRQTIGRVEALRYGVGFEHSWTEEGWAPYRPVVMTDDAGQTFATTVATGSGIITGTGAGHGNHRVAYLRDCTTWADSEMTSLILPPVGWNNGGAQVGHFHRVRERLPGQWEAIAVWTAVVGGDYGLLNTRGVRFDGATLLQSDGDIASSADTPFIDRSLRIWGRQRFQFGSWINEYHALPTHLWGLSVGDLVTTTSVSGTGFNETAQPVTNVDRIGGIVQLADPSDTGAVAFAITPGGTLTPAGTSAEKRWAPYWLSTRVVGGTSSAATVEWMRWRYGEPQPDWSDARVQRKAIAANANVPELATAPGQCGLWGAHFHDGSAGMFGRARFREICRP